MIMGFSWRFWMILDDFGIPPIQMESKSHHSSDASATLALRLVGHLGSWPWWAGLSRLRRGMIGMGPSLGFVSTKHIKHGNGEIPLMTING